MLPIGVYPRNHWYVTAFASDLTNEGPPLARTICDNRVALFRTANGRLAAVEDRCIHRGMPITQGGECRGEIIQCPYHGLEFDAAGRCVKIPGQERIPPGARIRTFPVIEKDALVWIWTGDPQLADPELIPSHSYHSDPAWAWSSIMIEFKCDWQLFNDNLLDLTHVGFIHRRTIGGNTEEHTSGATFEVKRIGNQVIANRYMPNSTPPPYYSEVHQFPGKIDRWQEIEFRPGFVRVASGGTDVGTGAYEGRRIGGVQQMGLHCIAPATATSCYDHYTICRNFKLESKDVHQKIHDGNVVTILEDKEVLDAQQARSLEEPDRSFIDTKWDAAGLIARRIVDEIVKAEQETSRSATVSA